MGAVPKRRGSKSRRNRRRAHDRLLLPSLAKCPKCKQAVRPHTKCPNCGHYGPVAKTDSPKGKQPPKATRKTATPKTKKNEA